jgi:hypothetical protein
VCLLPDELKKTELSRMDLRRKKRKAKKDKEIRRLQRKAVSKTSIFFGVFVLKDLF